MKLSYARSPYFFTQARQVSLRFLLCLDRLDLITARPSGFIKHELSEIDLASWYSAYYILLDRRQGKDMLVSFSPVLGIFSHDVIRGFLQMKSITDRR
jgi:hypothetical protein